MCQLLGVFVSLLELAQTQHLQKVVDRMRISMRDVEGKVFEIIRLVLLQGFSVPCADKIQ